LGFPAKLSNGGQIMRTGAPYWLKGTPIPFSAMEVFNASMYDIGPGNHCGVSVGVGMHRGHAGV
jgi:hypothetical protein